MCAAPIRHHCARESERIYGCSYEEVLSINGGLPIMDKTGMAYRYMTQRHAALKREVGWEITFAEWAALWNESGKWNLRGVGAGKFCMARNGDTGPYKVGNVRISPNVENWREAGPFASRTNRADPKGYTLMYRAKGKPYTARFRGKFVGNFATESEARDAYLAAKKAAA